MTQFNSGADSNLNEAVKSRLLANPDTNVLTDAELAKLSAVEAGATADQTGAEIKTAYEAQADTNAFTDAEKSKLAGIDALAEVNMVDNVNGQTGVVVLDADDIDDSTTINKFASAAQLTKIDTVETGATADQTGAEIVAALDTQLGSSAWQSGGGGAVDSVNTQIGAVVLDADDIDDTATTNKFATAAQLTKIDGVEAGATADQTGAEIKAAYEGEADTNAFTDAEKAKLAAIEAGASTDQTGAEIVSAVNTELGGTAWQSGGGGAVDSVNSQVGVVVLDAGDIAITDAGAFTAQADVEGALQEIYGVLGGHGDIVTENSADFVRKTEQEVIVFDASGDPNAVRPAQAANKTVIWFNYGATLPINIGAFDIAAGQELGVSEVNTQTGLTYTLAATDAGLSVDMDNAAANTLTIPDNATVAFPIGTIISITQLGAGVTSIQGAAGVTLNGAVAGSVAINNRFSGASLRKIAADIWIVQGDIT